MVWAIVAITFLSFIVWLHHFFTMGAGADVNAFFGIMTMIISVPTGVKVFNWLFTMYRGRVRLTSPMLWFLCFVMTFTIGGVTGVLMSVPAIDFQLHNSLFLVAHFHNMIIGGVLFGYFAGYTYWFPKIFGFKLQEGLGKLAVYLWLIGFLLAFMPLYVLGMMGATRRIDHYDASMGWQWLFIISAVGVVLVGAGIAAQLLQLVVSIWQRKKNSDTDGDIWDSRTLEWSIPSPMPYYTYATLPEVHSRDAFWEAKQVKLQANRSGVSTHRKPAYEGFYLPRNSPMGFLIAGAAFVFAFAFVWHIWWAAIGAFIGIVAFIVHRLSCDHEDTEYYISAQEIEKLDHDAQRRFA
jgi:cytochrome o ubiquinol oxidase subunit 1